jgi:hypothetical protein
MTTQTRRGTQGRSTGAATGQPGDAGATRAVGEVEAAVLRDLEGLRALDPDLADSALAASAIELARGMDNPRNSLTSKAMAQRALRETIDRLLELAPAPETQDRVDQLAATARRKLERGSAA